MNRTTEKVNKDEPWTWYRFWLTLCWLFGIRHKQYYESQPTITDVDASMDKFAMLLTRGKFVWGKTAVGECQCKVCKRKFWTLTRNSQVCKRYGCYMKFHLHPEQYTLKRVRAK